MGLQYVVVDKVKVQQYKVHNLIKTDDMCVLMVEESGHFTSTSTMVRTQYYGHHTWDRKIVGNAMILCYTSS